MVSLNYPITPLTEPLIDPLTGDIFEPTKYDWSISIAGASVENMDRMYDWVTQTIDENLAYQPTEGNPISCGKKQNHVHRSLFLLFCWLSDL